MGMRPVEAQLGGEESGWKPLKKAAPQRVIRVDGAPFDISEETTGLVSELIGQNLADGGGDPKVISKEKYSPLTELDRLLATLSLVDDGEINKDAVDRLVRVITLIIEEADQRLDAEALDDCRFEAIQTLTEYLNRLLYTQNTRLFAGRTQNELSIIAEEIVLGITENGRKNVRDYFLGELRKAADLRKAEKAEIEGQRKTKDEEVRLEKVHELCQKLCVISFKTGLSTRLKFNDKATPGIIIKTLEDIFSYFRARYNDPRKPSMVNLGTLEEFEGALEEELADSLVDYLSCNSKTDDRKGIFDYVSNIVRAIRTNSSIHGDANLSSLFSLIITENNRQNRLLEDLQLDLVANTPFFRLNVDRDEYELNDEAAPEVLRELFIKALKTLLTCKPNDNQELSNVALRLKQIFQKAFGEIEVDYESPFRDNDPKFSPSIIADRIHEYMMLYMEHPDSNPQQISEYAVFIAGDFIENILSPIVSRVNNRRVPGKKIIIDTETKGEHTKVGPAGKAIARQVFPKRFIPAAEQHNLYKPEWNNPPPLDTAQIGDEEREVDITDLGLQGVRGFLKANGTLLLKPVDDDTVDSEVDNIDVTDLGIDGLEEITPVDRILNTQAQEESPFADIIARLQKWAKSKVATAAFIATTLTSSGIAPDPQPKPGDLNDGKPVASDTLKDEKITQGAPLPEGVIIPPSDAKIAESADSTEPTPEERVVKLDHINLKTDSAAFLQSGVITIIETGDTIIHRIKASLKAEAGDKWSKIEKSIAQNPGMFVRMLKESGAIERNGNTVKKPNFNFVLKGDKVTINPENKDLTAIREIINGTKTGKLKGQQSSGIKYAQDNGGKASKKAGWFSRIKQKVGGFFARG